MGTVPSTPSTALDGDALGRAAIPFSLGEPEAFDASVDALMASLGAEVTVLGFGEALHHAVLGRLLLNFFSALARGSDWAASLAVRDAIMAENLRHILHGLRGRLLVHAHNQHLLRSQAV